MGKLYLGNKRLIKPCPLSNCKVSDFFDYLQNRSGFIVVETFFSVQIFSVGQIDDALFDLFIAERQIGKNPDVGKADLLI